MEEINLVHSIGKHAWKMMCNDSVLKLKDEFNVVPERPVLSLLLFSIVINELL